MLKYSSFKISQAAAKNRLPPRYGILFLELGIEASSFRAMTAILNVNEDRFSNNGFPAGDLESFDFL